MARDAGMTSGSRERGWMLLEGVVALSATVDYVIPAILRHSAQTSVIPRVYTSFPGLLRHP